MIKLTVTSKRQITFKAEVMSHLGIQPGEKIELHLLPDRKVRIQAAPRKPIKDLIGLLADKTKKVATIEEINEVASKGGSDER